MYVLEKRENWLNLEEDGKVRWRTILCLLPKLQGWAKDRDNSEERYLGVTFKKKEEGLGLRKRLSKLQE